MRDYSWFIPVALVFSLVFLVQFLFGASESPSIHAVSQVWLIRAAASVLPLKIFSSSLSATATEAVFVPTCGALTSVCALASI
jgi:hypothetical protein